MKELSVLLARQIIATLFQHNTFVNQVILVTIMKECYESKFVD